MRKEMRLTEREFRAMNNPVRRFLQRRLEFPVFKWLGLNQKDQDILEIGCGSGYGAVLLSRLEPKSYIGIDLMPEMIDLAKRQPGLENAEFLVMDATDMSLLPNESKDVAVIFDILHHIPKWREVIRECHRVLRGGGRVFLDEPSATAVKLWDGVFHWNHPEGARFSRREFEAHLCEVGLAIKRRLRLLPLAFYCLQKD
jgi:ubiquinone/menaquinone biosynthesis C-methylase UbiE